MAKRYEDEIRELLDRMEGFPGEGRRRTRPARRYPLATWLASLRDDPRRLMGGALLLTLCAWVLGAPWSRSFPILVAISGWTQLIGLALFVVAFWMLYRRGAFASSPGIGSTGSATRWRGQVIEMPRRGGLLATTMSLVRHWWRLATNRGGGPRIPPRRR